MSLNLSKEELKKIVLIIEKGLTGNLSLDRLCIRILRKIQDICLLKKYSDILDLIDEMLFNQDYLLYKDELNSQEENR